MCVYKSTLVQESATLVCQKCLRLSAPLGLPHTQGELRVLRLHILLCRRVPRRG